MLESNTLIVFMTLNEEEMPGEKKFQNGKWMQVSTDVF